MIARLHSNGAGRGKDALVAPFKVRRFFSEDKGQPAFQIVVPSNAVLPGDTVSKHVRYLARDFSLKSKGILQDLVASLSGLRGLRDSRVSKGLLQREVSERMRALAFRD